MKKLFYSRRSAFLILIICTGVLIQAKKPVASSTSLRGITMMADLAPALLVRLLPEDTESVPLGINDLDIDIKVTGNIAVTTMTLNFHNDVNRNLEGEFVFPLAEGQTIHHFAMDVQGKMRDGVVVEKEKGAEVFESIERRRIDPGLLEWTQGNNFRARVFPIPAKGYKKIVVGFQQELQSSPKAFIYSLPLAFKNRVKHLTIKAEVNGTELQPVATEQNYYVLNFAEMSDKAEAGTWVAQADYKNVIPNKIISFEIPYDKEKIPVYTELIPGTDNYYFYAVVRPENIQPQKELPHKLGILWDVSGSASERDRKKELSIIGAYLDKVGTIEVKVMAFSIAVHETKDFTITNGNSRDLRNYLEGFEPDGGTQLGCLDLTNSDRDEFLLFSDGLQNFGSGEIKFPKIPIHCVSTGSLADFSMLQYISSSTGGQFVNAQALNPAGASKQLMQISFNFISSKITGGNVSEMYPSRPTICNGSFGIAGIMSGKSGSLQLSFGLGSNASQTIKVNIHNKHKVENIVSRIWAQKKIAELDLQYDKNKDEITSLGKKFSVITRNTSLLVLDRLEDYIQYGIVPPDEDMKKQYVERAKGQIQSATAEAYSHMETVVANFRTISNWWDTDFKPVIPEPVKRGVDNSTTDSVSVGARGGTDQYRYDGNNDGIGQDRETRNLDEVVVISQHKRQVSHENVSMEVIQAEDISNLESQMLGVSESRSYGRSGASRSQSRNAPAFGDPLSRNDDRSVGPNTYSWAKGDFKLKEWDPKASYIDEIKKSASGDLYKKYLELRKKKANTPSFYIDVADYFDKQNKKDEALRILSNIAELQPENYQLMRIMAHRLQQWNENKAAIAAFEEVLRMRPEEPQSYRDLGLALEQNGEPQKAADLLCKVVNRKWDTRFPEIEDLAACEINHLKGTDGKSVRLDSLDSRLIKDMPTDVRVVINWDANDCDMDLWVTDPSGEKCFYSHPRTVAGGRISRDFTRGYGPEEFQLKKALPGTYKVQVNYYGNHQQTLAGPTTIQAEMYTNYGRPNETKKVITLRLTSEKEVVDLGEFEFVK